MNSNEAKEIFLQSLPKLSEPLKSAVEFTLANWKNTIREPRPSDVAINFFASLPSLPTNDVDDNFAAKLNEMAKILRDDVEIWFSTETLPHEDWRNVVGYEGLYQVSNYGRIKSFHSVCSRIIRYTSNKKIYPTVGLTKNGKTKNYGVHVLVATAFIKNPENFPVVHHKDNSKFNSCFWNLDWVTYSANARLAFQMGVKKSFGHVKKLTPNQVRYIRKNYKPYDKKFGARALAKKFNVNVNVITNVVKYKSYKNII